MAAETSDLDPLALAGAVEKVSERSTERGDIFGNTEVWPVDVFVRPGRSPPLIEVEPEVGCVLSDVGIVAQEADTHDRRAIGEAHGCAVHVRLGWWPAAVLPVLTYRSEFCDRDVRVGAAAEANDDRRRDGMLSRGRPRQRGAVVVSQLVVRDDAASSIRHSNRIASRVRRCHPGGR